MAFVKTLFVLLLLCPKLMADGELTFKEKITALEKHLNTVVKNYDAGASLFLDYTIANNNSERLPGIPANIRAIMAGENSMAEQITITVAIRTDQFPAAAQEKIKSLCKRYAKNVALVLDEMKDEIGEKEARPPLIAKLYQKLTSAKNFSPMLLLGIVAPIVLVLIFGIFMHHRSFANATTKITSALQNVLNGTPAARTTSNQALKTKATSTDGEPFFKTFSDDSLCALVSDCYWCKEDDMAAYIWRRLPSERRKVLLERFIPMLPYVEQLTSFEGDYQAFDEDIYYLNPLPIEKISNEDLEKYLPNQQWLYWTISTMRRNHLKIEITNCLKIIRSSQSMQPKIDFLKGLKASAPRAIERKIIIPITSVEDEEKLLALKDLSFEEMCSLPSLVWCIKLAPEDLAELLAEFSARDIASTLVCPPAITTLILQSLPAQKAKLVESYKQQRAPERGSSSHRHLCQKILAAIKTKVSTHNSPLEDAA